MLTHYNNIVFLFNDFENKEDGLNKKKNFYSHIISSVFEVALFSFELTTQQISDYLDNQNINKNIQVLFFILVMMLVIPLSSQLIVLLFSKIFFIFRKFKLFRRTADKEMYDNFYQYVFPICSNINYLLISESFESFLSDKETRYLKIISSKLQKYLTSCHNIRDMFINDSKNSSTVNNRIFESDFKFCNDIICKILSSNN